MKFDSKQLRAMSALRMLKHVPRVVTPYGSIEHVQKLAHHYLHKCRDNIQIGIDVTPQELQQITWSDLFTFAPEDIWGFSLSEKEKPQMLLYLHDRSALDVYGLFDDLRECTHFTVS